MNRHNIGRLNTIILTSLISIGCAVSCVACSLLPEEEDKYKIVLEPVETEVSYELAKVTKGDVRLSRKLYALYQEENGEELSFGLDGREVEAVFVVKGEDVKKGTLLAKLKSDDLEEEKASLKYTIERNNLLKAQARELTDYDIEKLSSRNLSTIDRENAITDLEKAYEAEIESYDDAVSVASLRLREVEEKLAGCKIYAGMDGTVSYVSAALTSGNNNYAKDTTVIRIVDSSHCVFVLENEEYKEYPDFFKEGNTVVLSNNQGDEYRTRVVPAGTGEGDIYLELEELDDRLTIGTRLFCDITVEEKKNVLRVTPDAVHSALDTYYVYKTDESGLKEIRYISVGLIGDEYIEITDGLKEGDVVVKK
ncbi:MAG: biotin/lipoyl-binding protein [Lachnospiraceae bacterium]|nr:biotin/lipoyl-binding protein [Lachnospiraceae bacterium]